MKTVAMRSESELFDRVSPEPRRSVLQRPLVKTLGESRASAQNASRQNAAQHSEMELEGFVLIEPRTLLSNVRERCAARAAAKEVGLTMHAAARSASVRPHAFAMAIRELVDNAIDASKRDQDVVVLVSETGDGDLLWQVQDDGVGMSKQELDAIGESSAGDALWSGIARARMVVEAHGGLIHFESTPTFGTTASVWLPRAGRA